MKRRWEEILKETPSGDLTARIERGVFAEMERETKASRRWWLMLASVSAGLAALVTGYRLVTTGDTGEAELSGFVDLADEDLDLETVEDLDVIEILEELEQWQNG